MRFRRKLIVIAVLAALTGCTRTVYVDRPVEVKVRVPAPCLEPADIPPAMVYPVDQLQPGVSDGDLFLGMLADRDQRAGMEEVLRALLTGCLGPDVQPKQSRKPSKSGACIGCCGQNNLL